MSKAKAKQKAAPAPIGNRSYVVDGGKVTCDGKPVSKEEADEVLASVKRSTKRMRPPRNNGKGDKPGGD